MISAAWSIASWYLVSLIIGWLAFPLAWRVLNRLPDRGYGFARPIGLLVTGYLVWIGATAGLIRNSPAGVVGAIALLAGLSALALRGNGRQWLEWMRQNGRSLWLMEGLFLLAFIGWAFVRSNSPEIVATEKPMELAFLNALSHSATFPPPDPWLSGYAISYYFFGFVLSSLLTMLTGVTTGVAFNLTSAMWFGLTVLASYSLLYNLIKLRHSDASLSAPLLGPLFVVISGNLEGFLELLHARQWFWQTSPDGLMTSAFWGWLDIKELVNPPFGTPAWIPSRNWWWWRASRVVRDLNLAGIDHEVIDEFPFFSFLLADNHPHVLALPFVLLAVAVCFQLYLAGRREVSTGFWNISREQFRWLWVGVGSLLTLIVGGVRLAKLLSQPISVVDPVGIALGVAGPVLLALAVGTFLLYLAVGKAPSLLPPATFVLVAWLFGAFAFLNTWDFPIYTGLLLLVLLYQGRHLGWVSDLRATASTALGLVLLGVVFYLPWYPTFSSQAGGILPNIGFPTKFQQFVVMFGTSAVPLTVMLIRRIRRQRVWNFRRFLMIAVGLPLALFLLSWSLAGLIGTARGSMAIGAALDQLGAASIDAGIRAALGRRLLHSWTALALGGVVAGVWLLVRGGSQESIESQEPVLEHADVPTWPFIAMLIAVGALLILGPEFVYLQDLFGTRMNTIFKFYFAAWILWGVAAAYATYELWPRKGEGSIAWARTLVVIPLLLGLFYPVMSLTTRTQGFNPAAGRTLDGIAHLERDNPADAQAIAWLNQQGVTGVVAEAVGGSYSQYARIATHTGLSTVLGWEFHEVQWRGSADALGNRNPDIESMYQARTWSEAKDVVDRYRIDYVYVGPLERSTYGTIRLDVFEAFMTPIYQQNDVTIFRTVEEAGAR
ncbi:MAG: DUF2298 domain-containing protein [Anaerolineales bacterium]